MASAGLNIANAFGLDPIEVKVEWGRAVKVDVVEKQLEAPSGHSKRHDPGERDLNHGAPSGKGNCKANEERDHCFSSMVSRPWECFPYPSTNGASMRWSRGSQKALMLPPGLGFIALQRAAPGERPRKPSCLASISTSISNARIRQRGSGAFTPAVSLIFGLRASLNMMAREGFDRVYARHARMARATRAAATAMGLKLLAPDSPSPAATGIFLPKGLDADKVLDYLRDQMGVILAEGQDQLKGKAIRIAHVGYMGAFDVITAIAALEMALRKFGAEIPFGRGVAAAQEVLMEALN